MKNSFKKVASLFLVLTLLVSLVPSFTANAQMNIRFSVDKDVLKNKTTSSQDEDYIDISFAFIGPTSAIGKYAKSFDLTSISSVYEYYEFLDVTGKFPQVAIIDDAGKYAGIDFLNSDLSDKEYKIDDIKSVKYYITSADLTDYYYDEEYDQVVFVETLYDAIITAPNETIDLKEIMTDYNSKTDIFYIEATLYSEDITKELPEDSYEEEYIIDEQILFGPIVFRSQLNGHAGKLVEDIRNIESNEIYRIKNPTNNEKLYTTDKNEVVVNCLRGWEIETSIGNAFLADDENAVPVYRLYNKKTLEHLYTTDSHEVEVLTSKGTWTSDNDGKPMFYGSNSEEGNNGVYRLVNAKGKAPGRRLLTADSYEIQVLTTKSTYTVDNDNKPIFYISPITK